MIYYILNPLGYRLYTENLNLVKFNSINYANEWLELKICSLNEHLYSNLFKDISNWKIKLFNNPGVSVIKKYQYDI